MIPKKETPEGATTDCKGSNYSLKRNVFIESFEAEKLKKLIDNKKQYFDRQQNKAAEQHLQREILFLQNEIMPIVLNNTMIVHNEVAKYVARCTDEAINRYCNGLIVYIPIKDGYDIEPIIGMANCRDGVGAGAVQIFCPPVEVLNTDMVSHPENVTVIPILTQ